MVAKICRIKLEKLPKLEKITRFTLLFGQASLLQFWRRRLVIDPSSRVFEGRDLQLTNGAVKSVGDGLGTIMFGRLGRSTGGMDTPIWGNLVEEVS